MREFSKCVAPTVEANPNLATQLRELTAAISCAHEHPHSSERFSFCEAGELDRCKMYGWVCQDGDAPTCACTSTPPRWLVALLARSASLLHWPQAVALCGTAKFHCFNTDCRIYKEGADFHHPKEHCEASPHCQLQETEVCCCPRRHTPKLYAMRDAMLDGIWFCLFMSTWLKHVHVNGTTRFDVKGRRAV